MLQVTWFFRTLSLSLSLKKKKISKIRRFYQLNLFFSRFQRIDANFGPGCLVSPRGNQGLESGIQNVDTDTEWKAWRLTRDHVPKDEAEKKRIEESGGAILRDRVLGVVNITR